MPGLRMSSAPPDACTALLKGTAPVCPAGDEMWRKGDLVAVNRPAIRLLSRHPEAVRYLIVVELVQEVVRGGGSVSRPVCIRCCAWVCLCDRRWQVAFVRHIEIGKVRAGLALAPLKFGLHAHRRTMICSIVRHTSGDCWWIRLMRKRVGRCQTTQISCGTAR